MKNLLKPLLITCAIATPFSAISAEHNHSHNFFNPALEQLGNEIIGLTVCYKNGYLSDEVQEPVFANLIDYADVTGEELGLFYMDRLGQKAEEIMGDDEGRLIWDQTYCADLIDSYLDEHKLAAKANNNPHDHSHDHHHGHHHHDELDPEIAAQDLERGRLLSIN